MGFDPTVFLIAGIQESLNPVQLATAGVFALALLFLRDAKKGAMFWFVLVFLAVSFLLGAVFDLRVLDMILIAPGFFKTALYFYAVLGFVFLAIALAFLRGWWLLLLERSFILADFLPRPVVWKFVAQGMAVLTASCLVFFSNAWPSNYQVIFQGDMAWAPGMLFYSVGSLVFFEFCRNIGVVFVLAVFLLAGRGRALVILRQNRSLVSIMMAAAYFAVGTMLVFFSYMMNKNLTVTLS